MVGPVLFELEMSTLSIQHIWWLQMVVLLDSWMKEIKVVSDWYLKASWGEGRHWKCFGFAFLHSQIRHQFCKERNSIGFTQMSQVWTVSIEITWKRMYSMLLECTLQLVHFYYYFFQAFLLLTDYSSKINVKLGASVRMIHP